MRENTSALILRKEDPSARALVRAALTLLAALVLLYLCSTLVFYPMIRLFRAQAGENNPWSITANWTYIAVRGAWLMLALAVCGLVRKKTHSALEDCGPLRKKALTVSLAAFGVCALLDALWILDKAYFTVDAMIGVRRWPLFPAVLWEQLFYGDLGWMLLIGCVILFLPGMGRKKLALWEIGLMAAMVFVRFML